MAGQVQVTSELAPEISAVFALESDRPEWEFLKGSKLCSSQISITALVANQATARLRNPVGSGAIAIISQIEFSVDAIATCLIYRVTATADLTTLVATITRDTRYPALDASALIASQQNIASSGDFFFNAHLLANTPQYVKVPFVLTPGFAVDVNCETLNVGLRGNVHWLERRIGELEVG